MSKSEEFRNQHHTKRHNGELTIGKGPFEFDLEMPFPIRGVKLETVPNSIYHCGGCERGTDLTCWAADEHWLTVAGEIGSHEVTIYFTVWG